MALWIIYMFYVEKIVVMEKISVSDLSVGDWVRVINQFDAQIYGYHCESGSLSLKTRQGNLVYYRLEDITPIPLTPEILEKNGISKTYESDEYAVYKGEGFNVTEYYTELWEFERHRNRLMIRNVHQLQNALRLAGVGKEIKL